MEGDIFDDGFGGLDFEFDMNAAESTTKTEEPKFVDQDKEPEQKKVESEKKVEIIKDNDLDIDFGDSVPDKNEEEKGGDKTITESYFDYMKSNGLLDIPDDFEFDGTEDKLFEAHTVTTERLKDSALKSIFDSLPENVKNLTLYSLNGGDDINTMYGMLNPQPLSDDTEEGQIHAIKTYYKSFAGWDDSKVEKFLSRLDESDLKEEAKDALDKIEELTSKRNADILAAQEQEKITQKRLQEESIATLKKSITDASFIEAPRKKTLTNFIFNPVRRQDGQNTDYVRVLNKIQNNPNHMIQLADLLFDYDDEKGLVYERFEKKAGTTIRADLKKKLEQSVQTKTNSASKDKGTPDWTKFF